MAKEITWTPEAEKTHNSVVDYLKRDWSEKEVIRFIEKVNNIVEHISRHPLVYPIAGKEDVREAVITKHNILLYRIAGQKIFLLYFWDTRKNPAKKRKSK